jgi:signal transduction histidine kinase
VVVAGASTGDRAETLAALVRTFLVGGPIALLLASALGWALAALALRPVEAMTERAQQITLERSGERLPLPPADDEIGRLGRTLNEMLARIESSIERERAFVADAGHELRTPIAILRSELELGLRPDRDREDARAAMRSAIEEASRLETLASDLLTLARSDAPRLSIESRPIAVAELLAQTRDRFAGRAASADRAIDIEAAPELTWNLDPARIETALGNLVENALRHGAGTVTLQARIAGEELELSVADEGPGFPLGFEDRAFERFSRAETGRTTPGAGLGLAIVKAVAEAHGGTVAVEPGRAIVRIAVPRRASGSARASALST